MIGTGKRLNKRARLVMEQKLGRPLKVLEVVHHINGIKSDDRPENLQLFVDQSAHMEYHAAAGDITRRLKRAG